MVLIPRNKIVVRSGKLKKEAEIFASVETFEDYINLWLSFKNSKGRQSLDMNGISPLLFSRITFDFKEIYSLVFRKLKVICPKEDHDEERLNLVVAVAFVRSLTSLVCRVESSDKGESFLKSFEVHLDCDPRPIHGQPRTDERAFFGMCFTGDKK